MMKINPWSAPVLTSNHQMEIKISQLQVGAGGRAFRPTPPTYELEPATLTSVTTQTREPTRGQPATTKGARPPCASARARPEPGNQAPWIGQKRGPGPWSFS